MSVTYNKTLQYLTAANKLIWDNQSTCSVSFWFRLESAGLVVGQNQSLFGRGGKYNLTTGYTVATSSAVTHIARIHGPICTRSSR
jgi:hypothetical protein